MRQLIGKRTILLLALFYVINRRNAFDRAHKQKQMHTECEKTLFCVHQITNLW